MRRYKTIKVEVDPITWEEFFRLFPEKGERSSFLRSVIGLAIESGVRKDDWVKEVVKEVLENGL